MKNRTWAEIDINNLFFNIRQIKSVIPKKTAILAAVKANAYGHDSIEISRQLSGSVDMFGVASVDEALELREHGIKDDILILSPIIGSDIGKTLKNNIMTNINSLRFAEELNREAKKRNIIARAHIEIDTGMNRTGIDHREAVENVEKIFKMRNISAEGVFSHFAEAEKKNRSFSIEQKTRYDIIIKSLNDRGIEFKFLHFANSSALVNIKDSFYNLVRPGIMLYGHYTDKFLKDKINLKPVMRLKTRIGQIKNIKKGDSISYDRTFTAKRNMRIGTTLIGYGDGYPRLLSNKAEMFVCGCSCRVLGNVCMDLTMIDISSCNDVKPGDEVEVFGDNISVDTLAGLCGNINYEIITGIGPRVPRIFFRNGKYYEKTILSLNHNGG